MTQRTDSLSELRHQIDEIDAAIHDLLLERVETALRIGASKGDAPVWRPMREAQVLRRLATRHRGPFPTSALLRIWREIVSAMAGLQGNLTVAVYGPKGMEGCRDLSRDHFGAAVPTEVEETASAVLDAVRSGRATIGVLPSPDAGPVHSWWQSLASMPAPRPAICARLPFFEGAASKMSAYCVADLNHEESGDDHTVIAIQVPEGVGRAELTEGMTETGRKPERLIGEGPLFLAELKGCLDPADIRLHPFTSTGQATEKVTHLGVYASPIPAG